MTAVEVDVLVVDEPDVLVDELVEVLVEDSVVITVGIEVVDEVVDGRAMNWIVIELLRLA